MLVFPNFDPVILTVGPIELYWYGLAYVIGIIFGWMYLGWLCKPVLPGVSRQVFESVLIWAVLGILIGGRLGYAFIYHPLHFLAYPVDILKTWQGGMSFHGGLAGFVVAMFGFCRLYGLPFLKWMDLMACVAPIGIGLGRIANFINGELYGRITDVAWGIVFPHVDLYPRHPSQLYEALGEGLLLFMITNVLFYKSSLKHKSGVISGVFLVGYSAIRCILEQFRQPDDHLGFVWSGLTMGQIISIAMVFMGIGVIVWSYRRKVSIS